jgi:hypothetical protein
LKQEKQKDNHHAGSLSTLTWGSFFEEILPFWQSVFGLLQTDALSLPWLVCKGIKTDRWASN